MVGYVIGSAEKTDSVLSDVRLTIADLISDRYFATIQHLCREAGVTLTAQAMGNGLSCVTDNFRVKGQVDKPQTEFWARDKDGSYDIKEGASAAHRYEKRIASGEAFTDMKFSETLGDMKPLADFAYSCHINEFVVCASAYQPWLDKFPGSTGGGRHYCLNRNNTLWAGSKGFWDYQARCATMMRQGRPVVDVMVNGRKAGIVWCSPWTLDISRYVKKGMNQLVLKVSNVLSNRMIGDAGLPEHERVTFAQPQIYQPGDALMPSGLFGDAVSVLIY